MTRLIDRLAVLCYLSEDFLFAATIFRRLDYTMKDGIFELSAIDFAGTKLILTGKILNFQAGSTSARSALLLLARHESKSAPSRTFFVVYGFGFLQWTQGSHSVLKPLLQGYGNRHCGR